MLTCSGVYVRVFNVCVAGMFSVLFWHVFDTLSCDCRTVANTMASADDRDQYKQYSLEVNIHYLLT